jgi:2,5-diketo-D-gluconate reductase A
MKKSCYSIKLYNGVTIPATGYGTYKEAVSDETVKAIEQALKAGYRHIDTASRYGNEKCVGDAIKNSKIARNDIFVTTKLWNDKQGYNSTIKALNASLKELGFKYADLFLIHWPVSLGKEKQ